MRYLFLLIFLTTNTFSQNYHYAVDKASEKAAPDTTAPSSPTNLVADNITQNSATLNWTAATDNVGVVIYRVYNNGILLNSTESSVTSYKLTGLSPNTEYNITVRAVDFAANESLDSNKIRFNTESFLANSNMPEEKIYFDCYQLPLAQKSQLQSALDTYGCVRLEKGNYSGTAITMKSNQSLYGFPTSKLSDKTTPDITIAAGSTNVLIDNISGATITFQSGSAITNSTFKNIFYSTLVTTNGIIENCEFINLDHAKINFNSSSSGYLRNNRIIKQWVQGGTPQVVMKGNNMTPSYGNIQAFIIYQTSNGNVSDIDNMGDMTYIGIDAEAWGFTSPVTQAMLKMNN